MDIMELGAIGELVGGLAVIGSLVYVGLQVQQSNRLEKAESIRSVTRDYVSVLLQVDGPLFRRAVIDFESLPPDDQMRAHMWLIAFFQVGRTEIALKSLNLAEEGDVPQVLAGLTRSPGLAYWWGLVAPTFGADFCRYVDNAVGIQTAQGEPPLGERFPWMSAGAAVEQAR